MPLNPDVIDVFYYLCRECGDISEISRQRDQKCIRHRKFDWQPYHAMGNNSTLARVNLSISAFKCIPEFKNGHEPEGPGDSALLVLAE